MEKKRDRGRTNEKEFSCKVFPHKGFWLVIVGLFLLSLVYIISVSNPLMTGGSTIQIPYLLPERTMFGEAKFIPGLFTYNIWSNHTIKNGQLTITVDDGIPFDGPAFSKFRISATNAKIEVIDMTLKIPEQQLLAQGISPEDVAFYANGENIPLTFLKEESGFRFYRAIVTGVGEFVIGKGLPAEPLSEEIIEEITVEPSPRVPQRRIIEERPTRWSWLRRWMGIE